MKRNTGKKIKWIVSGVAVYLLLLAALTAAEAGQEDASIQSFADALWYSLVTLSTVGYGDLYPVTPAGKLIGVLFVLLSVGALAFVVGAVVSALTGRMLPLMKLRLCRNKEWYVFSACNGSTLTLAKNIREEDPKCALLFPLADRDAVPEELNCFFYPGSAEGIARMKKDRCTVLLMDEHSDNYDRALSLLDTGHRICCRTEYLPDRCPENLILFDRYACCAREYWQSDPLPLKKNTVVLIGYGKYARELLERGLLINVFPPEYPVSYHMFGQWQDFCLEHPQLGLTLDVDKQDPQRDSVYFHREAWNADPELIYHADRILICGDDGQENLDILAKLRRYFPVRGEVHLRSSRPIPGERTFGTDEDIYTAEIVLAEKLTRIARTMHRIYLDSTGADDPKWETLSEFTRQSNMAAADHLAVKLRLLTGKGEMTAENCRAGYQEYCRTGPERGEEYLELEHMRWMRFHSLYNWRWGSVRDNAARIHPQLVPYEQLSRTEQEKDSYAWCLLEQMSKKMNKDMEA